MKKNLENNVSENVVVMDNETMEAIIEDYDNVSDEQKNRIIRECIKRVDIEKDGITNMGKFIEIYMIDDSKHSVHMTKKGNYFKTYIIINGEETDLEGFKITKRFIRKKY